MDLRKQSPSTAGIVAVGLLASRILGLVRDALTARYFAPEIRDAFVIAFRLPNFFRRALGEGAFSSALVPTLAHARSKEERAKLSASVFAIFMAGASALTLLGCIFMEPALRLLLSGDAFMGVPGKFELTVVISRIMFGFLALAAGYAYFTATLHSAGRFAAAAVAPVLLNSTMIAVAFIAQKDSVSMARSLAWSVLVGGCLQLAVVALAAWRAGEWPYAKWITLSRAAARVTAEFLPIAFGSSLLQLTALVNLWFASRLPQGSHSHLYLADRILELPLSLIVSAVGSTALPGLAVLLAKDQHHQFATDFRSSMSLAFFLALPNAIGMVALAAPIAAVLFVGERFSAQEGAQTAVLIQINGLALIAAVGGRMLCQAYYAARRPWIPAIACVIGLSTHAGLCELLINKQGLTALALAAVGGQTVQCAALALASRWRMPMPLSWLPRARELRRFAVCGLGAWLGAQSHGPLLSLVIAVAMPQWIALAGAIIISGASYLVVSFALGLSCLSPLVARFRRAGGV